MRTINNIQIGVKAHFIVIYIFTHNIMYKDYILINYSIQESKQDYKDERANERKL